MKHDNSIQAEAVSAWKQEWGAEPYRSYLYSYPHKTAYRPFESPRSMEELWAEEAAETYFLYMHVPFCGARCGFCNLFTLPDKRVHVHEQYMDALERQAKQWAPYVSGKPFARFAIGGGTPTLLNEAQLERLFTIAVDTMGLDTQQASISVETSPETITHEKLQILQAHRVDRVSMGIQSFIEAEAAAIYRPQNPAVVEHALEILKQYSFPILNLDLIYGLPGQTVASWMYSLERALSYEPEEIFLYPLYTREHTIVKPENIRKSGDDLRMACYQEARERLLASGYTQFSMRRFAKISSENGQEAKVLLPYGCQEEGMVGLGCGARSYTRGVHYATRYGVSRKATASIIEEFVQAKRHDLIEYGFELDMQEQRRRFILKAILHVEGLSLQEYYDRFGTHVLDDYPDLEMLVAADWAELDGKLLVLTPEGLAYSDAIGDWFISPDVRERMEAFVLP